MFSKNLIELFELFELLVPNLMAKAWIEVSVKSVFMKPASAVGRRVAIIGTKFNIVTFKNGHFYFWHRLYFTNPGVGR